MMNRMDRTTRMRLLRVLTSAAWVDGEVQDAERTFVSKLLDRLALSPDERVEALRWLDTPPQPGEVDPTRIPIEHRSSLVALVRELVHADGTASDEENELVETLRAILLDE